MKGTERIPLPIRRPKTDAVLIYASCSPRGMILLNRLNLLPATTWMNRFISLLLIPMFMLGNVLPHSHAGSGVVEPNGHAHRPHLHLSAHHRHDHDDDDHEHHHVDDPSESEQGATAASATLSVPIDHDSDAVYFIDTDWTASRAVATPHVDAAALAWTAFVPTVDRDSRPGCRCGNPPDRYVGLPVYLLTASLRL